MSPRSPSYSYHTPIPPSLGIQHDILALSVLSSSLFSSAANGTVQRWDLRTFRLGGEWLAHDNIVLASDVRTLRRSRTQGWLLTGGNDATVKVRFPLELWGAFLGADGFGD